MKAIMLIQVAIILVFLQFGCIDNSTEPEKTLDDDTSGVIVRKPNIYIYPTEEVKLNVKINFPSGGKVIESIPQYDRVWEVTVDTNGVINGEYGYLYYECDVPDLNQKERGWLIDKDSLETFFNNNMKFQGFSKTEIQDFIDYWIPLLKDYDYYEIYPQYGTVIAKMVTIEFSETPTHFFRLFYFIKGRSDKNFELSKPDIEYANRKDFFALEWGVILK